MPRTLVDGLTDWGKGVLVRQRGILTEDYRNSLAGPGPEDKMSSDDRDNNHRQKIQLR